MSRAGFSALVSLVPALWAAYWVVKTGWERHVPAGKLLTVMLIISGLVGGAAFVIVYYAPGLWGRG